MLAILFYDVVVAVHVMAVVIAFGVTFSTRCVMPWFRRKHPEAMPTVHEMQARIGADDHARRWSSCCLTGIYLATDGDSGRRPG